MDIQKENEGKASKLTKEEKELKCIFLKKFTCPVCDQNFKDRVVKNKYVHLVRTNRDLRPIHKGIDTGKYDVIVCPHCGYAALSRYFKIVVEQQKSDIEKMISTHFFELDNDEEKKICSYEEAIERYKLAMVNAVAKKANISEKAYLCLKMAWILRGIREKEKKNESRECQDAYQVLENNYLEQAHRGFLAAAESENYPMCGMDEETIQYLLAALETEIDQVEQASKRIVQILHSSNVSEAIIQKTQNLKNYISNIKNLG